jgi:A/G-specific adenine glycosylase
MKKAGTKSIKNSFSAILLKWNKEENRREMPWKGEKNPYRIWLSEIILQQTRVEQGLEYYHRFIERFPAVNDLAAAPDTAVFKLWEGLGYYSRCRNLLATARFIAHERKGIFPDTYEDIKALKGIGPYTAAAISSFAYNLPHAVVDGNVFRVLSRIFGIAKPIDSTEGKKYFIQLADELLDKKQPGLYNQAIMDFGAIVCKPALPLCSSCVFNSHCEAYRLDKVNEWPVKEKKITIRKRWFYYLVMEYKGTMAIQQRTGKDIWNQLYEFPVIETNTEQESAYILKQAENQDLLLPKKYTKISISPLFKQQLSHQLIAGQFITLQLDKKPAIKNIIWLTINEMTDYPFPKFINQFLKENKGHQSLF